MSDVEAVEAQLKQRRADMGRLVDRMRTARDAGELASLRHWRKIVQTEIDVAVNYLSGVRPRQ